MDIQVTWFDETQTIVSMKFPEQWSWPDFHEAVRKSQALHSSVNHPVYAIADYSQSVKTPALSVPDLRRIASRSTGVSNLKRTYIVGSGVRVRMLLEIFGRLFPSAFRKYQVAENVDKALEQIDALRMSAA